MANFRIVRKGYDVEQVDSFLLTQATAWSTELAQSRQENAELRAHLARQAQEVEAASLSAQSHAVAPNAAANQTDVEIIARAETTAARMLAEADQQAQTRVRAALRAQEEVLAQRQQDLDARFARSKAQYEQILSALQAKVGELQETREALVSGLETIAAGGLAAIEGFSDELPATDLDKPAELASSPQPEARSSSPRNLDRTSELEAAVAAEIRAAAEAHAAAGQHTAAQTGGVDFVDPAPAEVADPVLADPTLGEVVEPAPADAAIAPVGLADTSTAEAHIADAESQLASAEANLASLEQRLSDTDAWAPVADDEAAVADDQLAHDDEGETDVAEQRVLVPPSILGSPSEPDAKPEPAEPAAETEGFQSVDEEQDTDEVNSEAADQPSEPQPEDEDVAAVAHDESTDEVDGDGAGADQEAGEAEAGDSNDSSSATDEGNEPSLEEFTAGLVDPAWTQDETLPPPADDNAMAGATAASLAGVSPEVDTAEHPITAGGSNGLATSSFQWNEPSS